MSVEQFKDATGKFINTKWMRVCAVICILFVFGIFPLFWGSGNSRQAQEWYNTGMQYYNERKFRDAAYWLEKSADAGNPDAQYMLDYEKGRKPDSSHISFEATLQWKANYERGY